MRDTGRFIYLSEDSKKKCLRIKVDYNFKSVSDALTFILNHREKLKNQNA